MMTDTGNVESTENRREPLTFDGDDGRDGSATTAPVGPVDASLAVRNGDGRPAAGAVRSRRVPEPAGLGVESPPPHHFRSIPPVAAVALLFLLPTGGTTLWLWWGPERHRWLGAVLTALTVLAAVLCLIYGSLAVWVRLTRDRAPIYELLPRHTSGPVLIIPVATTLSTSLLTVGVAVGTLTLGDAPTVPVETRPYMAMMSVVGLVIGLVTPWAVAHVIRSERDGTDVAILDPDAPPQRVLAALQRRWDHLSGMKRVVYPARRRAALGALAHAPDRAWPTGPHHNRATRPAPLVAGIGLLGCTSMIVLVLEALDLLPDDTWLVGGALAAVPGSTTALAAVLIGYTLAAQEQRNASLLRNARSSAEQRLEDMRVTAAEAKLPKDRGRPSAEAIESALTAHLLEKTRIEMLREVVRKGRRWR